MTKKCFSNIDQLRFGCVESQTFLLANYIFNSQLNKRLKKIINHRMRQIGFPVTQTITSLRIFQLKAYGIMINI